MSLDVSQFVRGAEQLHYAARQLFTQPIIDVQQQPTQDECDMLRRELGALHCGPRDVPNPFVVKKKD